MSASIDRMARVSVDYSQYWVTAGPDVGANEDLIPGLLEGLGPQAILIVTGRQWGRVPVRVLATADPPAGLEPGWDVVAEVDLECPDGEISVLDWGGPDHPEFGQLAVAGPGRYRFRVHAKNRVQTTDGQRSAEEHYLRIWPVSDACAARLVTELDNFGIEFTRANQSEAPPMDILDLAAATAIEELAALVQRPDPPELSGELAQVRSQLVVPGTARRAWSVVAEPWTWVGSVGGSSSADFTVSLDWQELEVRGSVVVSEPGKRVAFTWSWTTTRAEFVDRPVEYLLSYDPRRDVSSYRPVGGRTEIRVPSWRLPAEPSVVEIKLSRQGKGETLVELEHRGLPVELVGQAQPFWDWALREVGNRLTKAPFYGYPWTR